MLGKLFGPLTVMALGMVLRSVSFEFRIRARTEIKPRWIFGFWVGSLLTALGQGMVLGRIATDYQADSGYGWFAFFVGLCVMATLTRQFEKILLQSALDASRGRRVEAASRLGIGRNTITRKLRELGIDDE